MYAVTCTASPMGRDWSRLIRLLIAMLIDDFYRFHLISSCALLPLRWLTLIYLKNVLIWVLKALTCIYVQYNGLLWYHMLVIGFGWVSAATHLTPFLSCTLADRLEYSWDASTKPSLNASTPHAHPLTQHGSISCCLSNYPLLAPHPPEEIAAVWSKLGRS